VPGLVWAWLAYASTMERKLTWMRVSLQVLAHARCDASPPVGLSPLPLVLHQLYWAAQDHNGTEGARSAEMGDQDG